MLSATWAGRRRIPARRRRQKHRLYKIQSRHVAAFVVAVSWATAVLQAGLLGPVWSLLSWAVLRASDSHAPWRWCVAMTHSLLFAAAASFVPLRAALGAATVGTACLWAFSWLPFPTLSLALELFKNTERRSSSSRRPGLHTVAAAAMGLRQRNGSSW